MRISIPITLALLLAAVASRAETGLEPGVQASPSGERPNIYSPVGKRDPFKAPTSKSTNREAGSVSPLERFPVERFELKAVLRGLGNARAMVADPEGGTHIVKQGDRLGRERAVISKILNTELIVTERSFNYLGEETLYEKVLSLPAEVIPVAPQAPSRGNASGPNPVGQTPGVPSVTLPGSVALPGNPTL